MKKCIIVLIDERHPSRVDDLIKNLNTYFVPNNKNVDLLLFHETNFPKSQITMKYDGGDLIFHNINLYDIEQSKLIGMSEKYYGFSMGYRMMCRFFSGIVFKILKQYNYDYVMRLDSDSSFYEIVDRDIFEEFNRSNCYYGYVTVQNDRMEVRINLWEETVNYIKKNNLETKVSIEDTMAHQYNLVYYNNFEMVKLSEFIKEEYLNYFDYLDSTNGFVKYRWGDAAVRFLYIHLFLDSNKVFYFKDLAYFHSEKYKNRPFTIRDLYLYF